MALMGTIQPIVEKFSGPLRNGAETEKILNNVKTESGMDILPDNLGSLASRSFDILEEHLKEKIELMTSFEVEQKYLFLMAFVTLGEILGYRVIIKQAQCF